MIPVGDKVRAMLADLLVLNLEEIKPESLLVDDLDADSIAFLELWFLLEKEFGLELPEVKADEELLSMPLLPGLERLEAIGGDTTFFEFIKREIETRGMAAAQPRLVTEAAPALDRARRAGLAAQHTVASLSAIVGGRAPAGFSPDTPLTELRLRDLFRFLTVDALSQYVCFLVTLKEEGQRPA